MITVLFLAAEADPLVKVGGLGDVAGSLPRAIQRLPPEKTGVLKIDLRVVIPFHTPIHQRDVHPEYLFEFEVPVQDGVLLAQAYTIQENGVCTYLIDGAPVRADDFIYSPDPAILGEKYVFFSLAALELAKKLDWQPDILHANDWHTALSVYALKSVKSDDPFWKGTRSVITLHNLPFMGAGSEAALEHFGISPSQDPRLPEWARSIPLPLGLQSAERIVVVSPNYARELLTPEYGCGLEAFFQARQEAMVGILNGIDDERWNPATDPELPANFTASSLTRRKLNKTALQNEFGLDPDPSIPLLVMILRLDQQKGIDLAIEGLRKLQQERWQAILLGTGDPQLEGACRQLEADFPERVRTAIRFDVRLSRRLYGGGDLLLMPSRHEPCGLAQMMAMRYGCVPLARATGGLQDTIVDVDRSAQGGTGLLFQAATAEALAETIQRALSVYRDPTSWAMIQERDMLQDFSWENSAEQYVRVYRGE